MRDLELLGYYQLAYSVQGTHLQADAELVNRQDTVKVL